MTTSNRHPYPVQQSAYCCPVLADTPNGSSITHAPDPRSPGPFPMNDAGRHPDRGWHLVALQLPSTTLYLLNHCLIMHTHIECPLPLIRPMTTYTGIHYAHCDLNKALRKTVHLNISRAHYSSIIIHKHSTNCKYVNNETMKSIPTKTIYQSRVNDKHFRIYERSIHTELYFLNHPITYYNRCPATIRGRIVFKSYEITIRVPRVIYRCLPCLSDMYAMTYDTIHMSILQLLPPPRGNGQVIATGILTSWPTTTSSDVKIAALDPMATSPHPAVPKVGNADCSALVQYSLFNLYTNPHAYPHIVSYKPLLGWEVSYVGILCKKSVPMNTFGDLSADTHANEYVCKYNCKYLYGSSALYALYIIPVYRLVDHMLVYTEKRHSDCLYHCKLDCKYLYCLSAIYAMVGLPFIVVADITLIYIWRKGT